MNCHSQKRLACRLEPQGVKSVASGRLGYLRPEPKRPWPFGSWKGARSCLCPCAGPGRKWLPCIAELGLATPGHPLCAHGRSRKGGPRWSQRHVLSSSPSRLLVLLRVEAKPPCPAAPMPSSRLRTSGPQVPSLGTPLLSHGPLHDNRPEMPLSESSCSSTVPFESACGEDITTHTQGWGGPAGFGALGPLS